MEKENLTHYKRLINPDYLGAYSLDPGKDLILTIASVKKENVTGPGGHTDQCTVARFKEGGKPMILNVTNCKMITNIYKTPYIEEWVGKQIQLYATEVKYQGEMVEALRIRPAAPKTVKPELTPDHKKWDAAKENIQNGNTTVEAIEKHYTISAENIKKLIGK